MKTVKTDVTHSEVAAAQGGINYDDSYVWVECPEHYDVDEINAEDIVYDCQITVVG